MKVKIHKKMVGLSSTEDKIVVGHGDEHRRLSFGV